MRSNKGQFEKGLIPWNKGVKGYMGANRTSFKKGDNSRPLEQRFWEKVKKYEKCWEWIAYKDSNGYGKIRVNGESLLAHRVSYSINIEPVEKEIVVMHLCDNPSCVRPEHLRKGTQLENMQDMDNKGRRVKGENASWAKLSQKQVEEIRLLYKQGGWTTRSLGTKYNVSNGQISQIINHKAWK